MRACRYEYPSHRAPSLTFVTVPSTSSALRLSLKFFTNCDSMGVAAVSMPR